MGLSRDDFSEVYLFFDYDGHQTNLEKTVHEDVICQMLKSFDNEKFLSDRRELLEFLHGGFLLDY